MTQIAGVTGQVNDFFRSATDAFAGIKDAASAEAAVPKLRELSTRLVALVKDLSARLMPSIDSLVAIPAVGDKIKALADELRRKLNGTGAA